MILEKVPPEVAALGAKLIKVGEEIGYIQKDAKNPHHGYKYASEKAIKEHCYPALRQENILFWTESNGESAQHFKVETVKGESAMLILPGAFHFLDCEGGGHISGDMAGSGRGGDDKGVYISVTGALKYVLTTMLGIVTGDDPESDHPVGGASTPGAGGSSPGAQPATSGPDLKPQERLVCPDCGTETTYGAIKAFAAKWPDKDGRWPKGKFVYNCPGCPTGPKGGKKVMSVAIALNHAIKEATDEADEPGDAGGAIGHRGY